MWLILGVTSYSQRVIWYHLVATTIRMDRSLCALCHLWIGNADTHSTWKIYNRVAITHLLHRLSQKRTYYKIYGIRPSNTITADSFEDKWVYQLQWHSWVHDKWPSAPYSSSEKSATWYVAAQNGSAHGICWQDNIEDASNRNKG